MARDGRPSALAVSSLASVLARLRAIRPPYEPTTFPRRPPMPRASWSGFLGLSLVTCPVYLAPATTESKRIRFNQLNAETGNRLKQQLINAETGEVVDDNRIGGQVSDAAKNLKAGITDALGSVKFRRLWEYVSRWGRVASNRLGLPPPPPDARESQPGKAADAEQRKCAGLRNWLAAFEAHTVVAGDGVTQAILHVDSVVRCNNEKRPARISERENETGEVPTLFLPGIRPDSTWSGPMSWSPS